MPKRKPTDMASMNLRLSEKLRKMIEVEAKKNGWSLNREMVRRLEKSFVDQLTEQVIDLAVNKTTLAVIQPIQAQLDDIIVQLVKMEKRNG